MAQINLMGIELEGAWHGTRGVRPFKDTKIKHDGSVRYQQPGADQFIHYGELVSDPMEPDKLAEWAAEHCPTLANSSAGTHIHVSMKSDAQYACLLTPSFQKRLIGALREYNETIRDSDPETYHRFLARLDGKNRYCKKSYKGLSQIGMTSRGSDRYQQLNYCYKLHGTLEIRVFPCTTNREFLKGLVLLTRDVIEDWVAKEYKSTKVRFRRG